MRIPWSLFDFISTKANEGALPFVPLQWKSTEKAKYQWPVETLPGCSIRGTEIIPLPPQLSSFKPLLPDDFPQLFWERQSPHPQGHVPQGQSQPSKGQWGEEAYWKIKQTIFAFQKFHPTWHLISWTWSWAARPDPVTHLCPAPWRWDKGCVFALGMLWGSEC